MVLCGQQHVLSHTHSGFGFVLSKILLVCLATIGLQAGGLPRICPNMKKKFENRFTVELPTQSDIQERLKWKFIHKYEYILGNTSWLIEMAFWHLQTHCRYGGGHSPCLEVTSWAHRVEEWREMHMTIFAVDPPKSASPSNAEKLKFDGKTLRNIKWPYLLLANTNSAQEKCNMLS